MDKYGAKKSALTSNAPAFNCCRFSSELSVNRPSNDNKLILAIPASHAAHRDAVILRRPRIGHTRVTHKYLLSGDSQPLCDECKCSLSVKHILLECCSLKHVRENYLTCSSLKELFENVDATTIVDFIKEVDFYHLV